MQLPSTREHSLAVIAALEAAGLTVGDHDKPDADRPYCIVYFVGGARGGSAGSPYDDAWFRVQTTSVAAEAGEAMLTDDRTAAVMLATPSTIAVTGRTVTVTPDTDVPRIDRDDATSGPPLFYAISQYVLRSVPQRQTQPA